MQEQNSHHFDAIVVGSGITGGLAAKELTEKGLKTLVLERGREVVHIRDYPTVNKAPWEYEFRKRPSPETLEEYPIQSKKYNFSEATKHFFASDKIHPYTTPDDQPFWLYRGFQTGGKGMIWGRQSYRWSEMDFESNAKDGFGVDWPVRYRDIAPWYEYVEKYVGISGQKEGLPQLPDGHFLPPMELNTVEKYFKSAIYEQLGIRLTIGRTSNLTVAHNNRGPCQYRNLCHLGCPYSGYFNSVTSTLPDARATGNMTYLADSIVSSVIYDSGTGKAKGVTVIDAKSKTTTEYFAKVIFLCASAFSTLRIMLNSTSDSFPNGIANGSGVLGKYIMDHFSNGYGAEVDGFLDKYYTGHRPNGFYIPRFQNLSGQDQNFTRGYGYQGGASRKGWSRGNTTEAFGAAFKEEMMKPGPWRIGITSFGECLPYEDNYVTLNQDLKDEWGMPVLHIHASYKDNEKKMLHHMRESAEEMLNVAGFRNISVGEPSVPGHKSHEMGGARMGNDPNTSIVNKWNQCHDVSNLFVTDGAFMSSAACQNPSLTYLAFTARAVDHAVRSLKKGDL